jgi:hypothetical protein
MTANSDQELEKDPVVLRYGISGYSLAVICFALASFVMFIGIEVAPPERLIESIAFVIVVLLFLGFGGAMLWEVIKARVTIDNQRIFAEAPWPGYPREIYWNEIYRVYYSHGYEGPGDIIICGTGRKSIKISTMYKDLKLLKRILVDRVNHRIDAEDMKYFLSAVKGKHKHPAERQKTRAVQSPKE